jgi:hypothetical protein
MRPSNPISRSGKIIRWVARIWSILVVGVVVVTVLIPAFIPTEPFLVTDWFLLCLWGVTILGLLVAWRWERAGATITLIACVFVELTRVILKGSWLANFLIVQIIAASPAILFLVANWAELKAQRALLQVRLDRASIQAPRGKTEEKTALDPKRTSK